MAEKKVFTSKLVRTSNIAKELLNVAKEYGLSVHDLEFKLIKTELYVKQYTEGDEEDEFHEATQSELDALNDTANPASLEYTIKQIYDAEIYLPEKPIFPHLNLVIAANKSLTAVYATIKAGSIIDATEHTAADIKAYFNRRKLRTNLLIDIWDSEMLAELNKISAQVEINGSFTFAEDLRILLSQSLSSKETRHDKLIIHFDEKKASEDDHGRVDHKKRGFITSVEDNELLITYMKPITGSQGRNCRGQIMDVAEADASHYPTFEIDPECIDVREDEEKIEYYARKNGYIDMDGSKYYIKEALEVSEISFKSTGNVNAGLNTDVAIHVKEKDSLKDAIGMGVEVEATDISVDGNVGSNSRVTAQNISIGGQTHKSSILKAPKIEINLHRGLAIGEDINIKRLEQGRVQGDTIFIEQAAGGEIIGKNIIIDILQSHTKVIASESITIKNMKGSENSLIIDQSKVGENVEALENLERELDETRIEINVAKKALDEEKALFAKHQGSIREIKERLSAYKKAGAKLPAAFVIKYKEFQHFQNKILQQEKDLQLLHDNFEMMGKRRAKFQSSVLSAKVINHGTWKGHNEVRFHLTAPAQELLYVPQEGLKESAIMLKYDEEQGEYSIITKSADLPDL